jgi:hypothetical protein
MMTPDEIERRREHNREHKRWLQEQREAQPQSLPEAMALYKDALGVPEHLDDDLELMHAAFVKGLEIGIGLGITVSLDDWMRWHSELDAWWDTFGRTR